LLGEEETVAVFVLHLLQSADDVVGALLEPRLAGGRPHEADGREVVAGDVAAEVSAVAVPARVRLRFRRQARPLAGAGRRYGRARAQAGTPRPVPARV